MTMSNQLPPLTNPVISSTIPLTAFLLWLRRHRRRQVPPPRGAGRHAGDGGGADQVHGEVRHRQDLGPLLRRRRPGRRGQGDDLRARVRSTPRCIIPFGGH